MACKSGKIAQTLAYVQKNVYLCSDFDFGTTIIIAEMEQWHWQEPGEAWKGVGLYHVTMTIPFRETLLGKLIIPNNDPKLARIDRTALGDALVDYLLSVPKYHPEIQILHFCLMPDHLHSVWYVRQTMQTGIMQVVRGFWQSAKRLGRAATRRSSSFTPNAIRENLQEEKLLLTSTADTLREQLGDAVYYTIEPIFGEIPFVRPMSQRRQLPATIQYIDMNPQRLATKILMPDTFSVQEGIDIAGQTYRSVGCADLLQAERYMPVHVRWTMADEANHGDDKRLRDYMNKCVLEARKGAVMVSPFISEYEKAVMQVLLKEGLPFIYIADNGFRDYYKPQDSLFDAVARKHVMILSPWEYDPKMTRVSRDRCVKMNNMAEEICHSLSTESFQ